MSQKQKVLIDLKRGDDVSSAIMWSFHGITRLSGIIHKLRKEGHIIETQMRSVQNRHGDWCRVAFYIYKGHKLDSAELFTPDLF